MGSAETVPVSRARANLPGAQTRQVCYPRDMNCERTGYDPDDEDDDYGYDKADGDDEDDASDDGDDE